MSGKEVDCGFPRMKQPFFVVCVASHMALGPLDQEESGAGRAEVVGVAPGRPHTSGAGRDLVETVGFGARIPELKTCLLSAVWPAPQFPHLEYGGNNSSHLLEW